MGFEFKPSIWFVCRYCRQAFRYLYKLKEHRVESHLGECLKTKCLIFEERVLDHEWIPYPNELECEDGPVSSSSSADTSNRRNSYKNPYVSLEPLTPKQLDASRNKNSLSYSRSVPAKTKSRSCRGTKRTADKLVTLQPPGDDEPCTEKKCNLDADRVETTIAAPAVENNIVFDSEVPKVELTIEELHQLAKNAVTPTSTSLLATESSIDNEVCRDSQEFELEDREFIVASIVKNSDGTENIQFVSTHIPKTVTAAESTLQKQFGTFGTFSRINGNLDLLNTTEKSATNTELPIENEINEGVTSDVLDFQIVKENNKNITFETRNVFKHDYDSICEPLSPEEYLPAETTNLSQTENSEEIVHDADNYECPDNIESRDEDENNDQVIDPGPASQGHSNINQILPSVVLTPEELSLPLLDWLDREKTTDVSNVILLDPDPTNQANQTFVDVNNLLPMKCVLCKLKLTSETKVKEHVKVCWAFNKAKHVYCVTCTKTYSCPFSLTRHCNKFHSPIISTPISRGISEVIDGNEAQALDFNLNQEEAQHHSQIISDSTSNTFSSEADPSVSRSRYSTRRHKSRVNYSETQACRGCAKDFYTVEDVEDHEKLCQLFKNKTKENKQAKETVDEEIQVIGSITKKNRTFEIASDEDDDKYESPNSESDKIENDDAECVLGRRSRSQGHSQINQILPTVTLSLEDLSLSLLDWITKEKGSDPSNVILLDPDPTSETLPVAVNDLHPTKCVLCKLVLTSDTQAKEHVKVCWTFNKAKHVYCVRCQKTYCRPDSLKRHCKNSHVPPNLITNKIIVETVDGTEAEVPDSNSYTVITETGFQINSDFISALNVSEANVSESGSRHSTGRKKPKLNYSETQTCKGCAKDFYTIADVEDHEKLCQLFRNKTNENKQAMETVDEEIQVIGSITKKTCTNEIASDDEDRYESLNNSESGTGNEDTDCILDHRPKSQGHSQINQILPTVTLSLEDLSLSLLDWITKEKANDPSNVILLDPDPTSETLTVAVNNLHLIMCILCKLELTSDTQVKEHVKVCWTFNKAIHVYCVPCKKTFWSPGNLKRHCKNSHVPPNLITTSVIVEAVDGTEAEAPDINSSAAITEMGSQIISDSISALNVSEANLSESVSRHTRRHKSRVDYSETQTCKGCAKDFYTVEDLEDHEQVCSHLKPKNIKNKETENKETEDDEIEVLRSTEKKTFANKVVGDDDNYECPDSSESNSDLESDGYVTDPGHPSHYSPRRRGAVPTITPSPEHLSLPLADWLKKEKINDPSNVILLDPDPTNETTVVEVTSLHPMKCVLCNQELTSDTQVKEHVKVCWNFRKTKYTYCVPCKTSFANNNGLYHHLREVHRSIPTTNLNFIPLKYDKPLKEWLVLQKQEKHLDGTLNVILIDPDPTLSDPDSPDMVIDSDHPVTCLLCQMLLFSDPEVRNHVENCWWHNKQNHRRCVHCEFTFETPKLLRNHQTYDHAEATQEESEDSDPEQVDVNNDVIRGLAEWLRKRQVKSSNVIRLDPDLTKATGPLTISKTTPIKCMLCNAKLITEFTVKAHAKMCWRYYKKIHRYCVPCEKGFSGEASLNEHNCNEHFPGPEFPLNCTACRTGFKDRVSKRFHTMSRLEFLNRIGSGKYAESSTASSKPPQTSLCEWLRQQKEENPSNCILLEPDPLYTAHNFEGVSEANPVKCKLCFREFTSELVLRSHVKICWIQNRRIHRHCVQCNKTYETMDKLKVHITWKHRKPMYECNVCGRKYFTLSKCKNHQLFHVDPDKAKPFKCETCHNSYQWKSMLYTHMLTHSSERTFKCPHCPKTFITKSAMKSHLAVHTLGKDDPTDSSKPSGTSLNCKFCDRFFTIKDKLKDHERSHTGERPYKCKVPNCSHTFSSQTYRTIHTKRKHGQQLGLTRFLCSSCGKTFPFQSELDYHVQRWHTETMDKPFKCPHEGCTKRFGMKFQIAPHMLIHSGEKPFQCEQCGLSFASKQTFKKHQLSHDDQGPGNKITCQLCPKTFLENRALQRHLKHHEEKVPKKNVRSKLKFKCKVCGKGYSTKPGLKKHEETHDDDEDESEEEEEEEEEQEEAESDSEESETSESSESENSDQDGEKIENNST